MRNSLLPIRCVLALTSFLAFWAKAGCLDHGGWTHAIQYVTGCYSDAVPFWGQRGVADGEIPYLQARIEYPAITGFAIWIEGIVSRSLFGQSVAGFLATVTLVNAVMAQIVLEALRRADVARPRLWTWALSPALVLYLGHNWDMLAAAPAVVALLAASRGRWWWAGMLIGFGVSAKLWPAVLLPGLAACALCVDGDMRARVEATLKLCLGALAVWMAANLPFAVLAPENWAWFYRFSAERGGTSAASWQILSDFGWLRTSIAERNRWASILTLVWTTGLLGVAWRRGISDPWRLAVPGAIGFLLLNKVWSPQFDIWLWPLLLATVSRPALLWAFAALDVGCYFAEFWMFAGEAGAWPSASRGDLALLAGLRDLVLLGCVFDIVWRNPTFTMRKRPEADPASTG